MCVMKIFFCLDHVKKGNSINVGLKKNLNNMLRIWTLPAEVSEEFKRNLLQLKDLC